MNIYMYNLFIFYYITELGIIIIIIITIIIKQRLKSTLSVENLVGIYIEIYIEIVKSGIRKSPTILTLQHL